MRIEVIVNHGSGSGHEADVKDRLGKAFEAHGAQAKISLARSGPEVISMAQEAARGDADVIVAAGGDGTISSVASVLVGSADGGKVLGVLPLGTMNHFAKDLNMPLELDDAVAAIVNGQETRVDVGEVNGRTFINNASFGLYPRIVGEREKRQRLGRGKWPAFVLAALAVLRRYPFLDVRLDVDGRQLALRTPFVFIGNNEYEMASLSVGKRAALDRGALSLYMTNRTGRLGLMRLALRMLFGGLHQEKDFVALRAAEIRIGTKRSRLHVALDGEVMVMEAPFQCRVRPLALGVMTPPLTQHADDRSSF